MHLLDFIFPKRCLRCGRLGRYLCSSCTRTILYVHANELVCPVCERLAIDGKIHPRCSKKYSLDGLISFFRYKGLIRTAIQTIKYRFVRDLASELTALISREMIEATLYALPKDCIPVLLPIPLHPARERNRGFNQSQCVGKVLSDRLQIPLRTGILRRVRYTAPQVSMKDRDAREKNMHEVFALNHGVTLVPCTVYILFDDVFTTGATLRSAASFLKRHGAQYVWGFTLAR